MRSFLHGSSFSQVLSTACLGHVMIAFPAANTLYLASIVLGFCLGAQLSLYFTIISELCGLKYYATLQSLGGFASPLGSYLLNVRVTGHLYDRVARRQHTGDGEFVKGELKCMGKDCFRISFLVMSTVSVVGSFISLILTLRTRKFYSQDIYSRFNTCSQAKEAECEVPCT
ncbi:hypothetical protein KP509_31G002700 [Ceratopteris richardii]|uniref:NFD4 C-terminal domain-containing protein n=1 Tax=Ceratopteris richardii TaxID=49495 RepID=A0A8T2QUX1_CERRI|nr:hypothetical protein KP509_31G002700 [Ceratopteris richardii]